MNMDLQFSLNKQIDPKEVISKNLDIDDLLSELEQKQLVKGVGMSFELPFNFEARHLFDLNYEPEYKAGVFDKFKEYPVEFWDIKSEKETIYQMLIYNESCAYIFEAGTLNDFVEYGLNHDDYFEPETEEQKEAGPALAKAHEQVIKEYPDSRLAKLDFFFIDDEW